jgi:hydrogenase expression/formation protein HypE
MPSAPKAAPDGPSAEPEHVRLAHGNGGRLMRELIAGVFARHLANPLLDLDCDACALPPDGGEPVVTTDGYTVQPLEFPGGDIGALAVHGTVNDLAVAGAEPRYLTLSAVIEEGLGMAQLERLVASLARAARECGVAVVAGDTKVVPRGQGGGLYLSVTGIGRRVAHATLGMSGIRVGDAVLVSGPVGDHGTAVMLARGEFGLTGDLRSDSASVLPLTRALYDLPGLRFLRDPTRGGLATVLHEIARATGLGVRVREAAIPVNEQVAAVCELLGYDPYYLACEGRVVAVVAAADAATALDRWRAHPQGQEAAIVGSIEDAASRVVLETALGGERLLDELEDDPLPRIC